MPVRVAVPASSANLGPGYDAFGLALGLYNEFEAVLAERWSVEITGEGAGSLRADEGNQVVRAMQATFAEAGVPENAASVRCANAVPLGRGLGSSSTAIVGGVRLANALAGDVLSSQRMFEIATALEGHPDNVAAALFGGFTVSAYDVKGELGCARIKPAGGMATLAVLGAGELPTKQSRSALPEVVPHALAAANVARAALVALGIALGNALYLEVGLHDTMHEPFRESLVPQMAEVRTVLAHAGGSPAFLSGAGPTMLSIVTAEDDEAALDKARSIAAAVGPELAALGRPQVLALPVDRSGARFL